jgi:hypothetical protein
VKLLHELGVRLPAFRRQHDMPAAAVVRHRSPLRQVVGVAKTANYGTLGEPPQPCVYVPLHQEFSHAAILYVRTAGDSTGALAAVQHEVRAIDHHIEVGDVRTIQKVIGQALFGATTGIGLLSVFGPPSAKAETGRAGSRGRCKRRYHRAGSCVHHADDSSRRASPWRALD